MGSPHARSTLIRVTPSRRPRTNPTRRGDSRQYDRRLKQTSTPPDVRGVGPSPGPETPGGETHSETDEAGGTTTADPKVSPGTTSQGSTCPPDLKTKEGKAEETACEDPPPPLGDEEPWRKKKIPSRESQTLAGGEAEDRNHRQETRAWRHELPTEKP